MKILVVDDSKANRRLVKSMLKHICCSLIEADNGREAMDHMEEHDIDLVVSDVDMPLMNGICLCKCIRASHHLSHIPIVMLTAHYDNQTRYEALNAGANAYLTKPVPKSKLIQHVTDLLQHNPASA